MSTLRYHSGLLAVLGAASLLATAASAQTMRIQVGDLTSADGVRAFEHRLDETAARFCAARYLPVELEKLAACRHAIREEALAQLSPAQLQAYQSARSGEHLAVNVR